MTSSANTWAANHFRKQSALLDGLPKTAATIGCCSKPSSSSPSKRLRADVHISVAAARR
jgi:hypothetical protein